MTCPQCGTVNNAEYIYCVNCGTSIPGKPSSFPDDEPSVETAYLPVRPPAPPTQHFEQPFEPTITENKKSKFPIVLLGVGLLGILIAAVAVGGYFLLDRSRQTADVLPDHLGIFYLDQNKTKTNELAKVESGNVIESKEKLLTAAVNSRSVGTPDIILYADGADIPLADLKFIDLSSIEADGNMKQIEFQAVPIEGKSAMKRLKFPSGVSNGKYAFAVFNGNLNDGKHRLWPIQVENSSKADNNDVAKIMTLDVSEKVANVSENTNTNIANTSVPIATPKPKAEAPVGSTVAFCNSSDVIVRASAGLDAKRLTKLKKGQRVFVIRYSENTDMWKGTESNWAYIQTENGKRGWVFTPFISQ